MGVSEAAQALDRAIRVATSDPAAGLPLAREALRACRWVRCLRVRSAALLGNILRDLGQSTRSERLFLAACRVADGCPCCTPIIDRQYARLLAEQKRFPEAVERADLAVENSKGEERTISLLYRGMVLFDARDPRAARDLEEALQQFDPSSPYHPLALANLAVALTFSETRDLERVARLLPRIKRSYRGIRGRSTERAKLAWLEGGIFAAQAETRKGWSQRSLWFRARKALRLAYRRLLKLGLKNDATAAWADLAAVQAEIDRFELAEMKPTAPPVFTELAATARACADSVEADAVANMWAALRDLRRATGCGDSLVPYRTGA